ncbi:MAG: RNA-binding S4 domain-containing protein [Pseudomonadota bacterium]
MTAAGDKLRVDKWLWHGRFFKTRSLAAALLKGPGLRINGTATQKPSAMVSPGDVLTFPQGDHVRVIQIDQLGSRRGPAPEAQALYTDLSPPEPRRDTPAPTNPGFDGKGRPSKKDRRRLDLSKTRYLD